MLSAVYQSAGYTTGLYTSPHLYDFRERIRINGQLVEQDFVVQFVEKIMASIRTVQPSFFEITVAMAFEWFAVKKVDMAIIEVGLGGRLDSTNIIQPQLSVITNIGWDHMNLLGNSLQEIAYEKAGIIKPHTPVVIGERQRETDAVFERKAKDSSASIYFAPDRFQVKEINLSDRLLQVSILDKTSNTTTAYESDLPGYYQAKNIVTVLQVVHLMNDPYLREALEKSIRKVKYTTGLSGRWEQIHDRPRLVLEVAHNAAGVEQMLRHIEKLSWTGLHFILGMVRDKDIAQVLSLFPSTAAYYFSQAQIPRALDGDELRQTAGVACLSGATYKDVNDAIKAALHQAAPDDLIVVCGSIFLVAEVNRDLFS